MRRKRHAAGATLVLLAVVASCSSDPGTRAGPDSETTTSTPKPSTTAGSTTAGSTTSTAAPLPTTLPPAQVESCPPIPPRRAPEAGRPRYELTVTARLQGETWDVEGTTDVRFVPDLPTDRLVFRLWPNGPRQLVQGTSLTTGQVMIDGTPAPSVLEAPTTLSVPVGRTLRPGEMVTASLRWTLHPPNRARDRISSEGESLRLGSFMPLLEWTPGTGWTTDPPTTQFHEAGAAPTADFHLTVNAPPGFDVLASGTPSGPHQWQATAMRDVAIAIGHFETASGLAHAPHPVQVTVGVAAGLGDSPDVYLQNAVRVLEDLSSRYGDYPWDTFSISVTPTISSGIEYPTHVLHGPGTFGRSLSHEVGHQWFYGLVGNNQSLHPWLDEGLSTWAEAQADGSTALYMARAIPAAAQGHVAEPITFWDDNSAVFYVGAYVQGAQALGSLGDPRLVDCALSVYVAQNAYRLATPADLISAAAAVFPDAEQILAGYGIRG